MGVGVAILHEEVVEGEIELVFADVVGEGVHDLAALLVPDIRFVLDKVDGTLATNLARSASEVAVEFVLVLEELAHVVCAVFLLHDHECGVLGECLGHHVGAFDASADELMRPPLVA